MVVGADLTTGQPGRWRPLSRRDDPTYDAPFVGMPRWLVGSLVDWMAAQVRRPGDRDDLEFDVSTLREIERRLRTPLSWRTGPAEAYEYLVCLMHLDPDFAFDVVDLLLSRLSGRHGRSRAAALERILREGGSAWMVVMRAGSARLDRRG